jgi:serine/threonine-protein kinase SRPK3
MHTPRLLSNIHFFVAHPFLGNPLHKRISPNGKLQPFNTNTKRFRSHHYPEPLFIASPNYLSLRTLKMTATSDIRTENRAQSQAQHLPALAQSDSDVVLHTDTQSRTHESIDDGVSPENESDGEYSQSIKPSRHERMYNIMEDIENIENYKAGGFYPLHIGDELDGGRFTIVHKLGFGGFSTVWLSRDNDQGKYVAIKISLAETFKEEENTTRILDHIKEQIGGDPTSQYICLPLEYFVAEGPNGKHMCNVFPVSGPSIAQLAEARLGKVGLDPQEAQRASLQVTQALAFLHSREVGIGHGDLTSSNVLLDIGNLDHLSSEQLYEAIGHPEMYPITTCSGEPLTKSAPEYVVAPADPLKLFPHRTGNIKIADFGSSYKLATPPTHLGLPAAYRSPELILHNVMGQAGDIWALAFVIFEIRGCGHLFDGFADWDREVLYSMRQTLGPLPRMILNEELQTSGLDEASDAEFLVRNRLWEFTKTYRDSYVPDPDYAFRIQVSKGVSKLWNYFMWAVTWRPWHIKGELVLATMSDEEMECFLDLLTKMLAYVVEKRSTATQLLCHPWFSRVFEKPSREEWKQDE